VGGACSTHECHEKNRTGGVVGKPEGKRLLGRPMCRWEDNIRMDLREIVWEVVDWIHLAQGRDHCQVLVNILMMNLRVP